MALGTYKHKRSKVSEAWKKGARSQGRVRGMRHIKVKVLIGRELEGGYRGWACITGSPSRGASRNAQFRCGPTVTASGPTAVTKKAMAALSRTLK